MRLGLAAACATWLWVAVGFGGCLAPAAEEPSVATAGVPAATSLPSSGRVGEAADALALRIAFRALATQTCEFEARAGGTSEAFAILATFTDASGLASASGGAGTPLLRARAGGLDFDTVEVAGAGGGRALGVMASGEFEAGEVEIALVATAVAPVEWEELDGAALRWTLACDGAVEDVRLEGSREALIASAGTGEGGAGVWASPPLRGVAVREGVTSTGEFASPRVVASAIVFELNLGVVRVVSPEEAHEWTATPQDAVAEVVEGGPGAWSVELDGLYAGAARVAIGGFAPIASIAEIGMSP